MSGSRLKEKRAVVTGAAAGIGRACAELFAQEGARLVLVDRDEAVVELVRELESTGAQATAIVGSVADEETMEAAFERADSLYGGVDVAVANAGITGALAPLLESTLEDWRKVLEVNLLGAFLCIKHGGRRMVQAGAGSVICTSSVAGLRAGAGPAHYSASKAAVINLVQNAAFQLGGTGVRVNAICPGLIETAMTQPIFELARSAGKEDRLGRLNPARRAGQPPEMAEVALFLASDAASYVNGHALVADGGLSAAHPHVPGRNW